jgi:hypothetical protein
MKRLAAPRAVVAGCALVIATNAAMLALSAWNRSGEPEATLTLTERELHLPFARQRDDGHLRLTLAIAIDAPPAARRAAPWRGQRLPDFDLPWLDRTKLRELGVRVDDEPAAEEHGVDWGFERRVFVVLELEGEAWRRWIAAREAEAAAAGDEDSEALLALDRTSRSRLVPVDAGLDPRALRERYADRERYLVLPAVASARWSRRGGAALDLVGEVRLVPACSVTVPASLRPLFEPLVPSESIDEAVARERAAAPNGWPAPLAPRYRAVLSIGRTRAPWLVEATRIDR